MNTATAELHVAAVAKATGETAWAGAYALGVDQFVGSAVPGSGWFGAGHQ